MNMLRQGRKIFKYLDSLPQKTGTYSCVKQINFSLETKLLSSSAYFNQKSNNRGKKSQNQPTLPTKVSSRFESNVKFDNGPKSSNSSPQAIFKPVVVLPNPDDIDLGEEIAGKINKQALLKKLNLFYQDKDIKAL